MGVAAGLKLSCNCLKPRGSFTNNVNLSVIGGEDKFRPKEVRLRDFGYSQYR